MKMIVVLLFIFSLSCAANVDKEIEKTTQGLKEKLQREKTLTNQLEVLGAEVEKYNKQINTLDKKITTSTTLIKQNEGTVKKRVQELSNLDKKHIQLEEQRAGIEQELVKYLSEELAFMILLDGYSLNSPEEMIQQDVFHLLSVNSKDNINNLSHEQNGIINNIKNIENEIEKTKLFIQRENERQKELDESKKKQKEALIGLNSELKKYNNELSTILQERDSLQALLKSLNVKKEEEKERLARQRERELAQKNMQQASKTPNNIQKIDVRQVGSSYHDVKTIKYKGKKTIAPLERYKIDRKFGPYYDPIYNLRTFSESVTFIPLEKDSKVKSVFNGEVIFAKEVPLLKRVVVIKHSNDIHTIYAQLDKIAPSISVGKKVTQGFVIGSVNNKLMLEVTQKNLHVDPLELINVK